MLTRRVVSNFDWGLIFSVVVLSALSVLFIHSAMYGSRSISYWEKQIFWLAIGLLILVSAVYFDYHTYVEYSTLLYLLAILALLYVLVFGKTIHNTRGWVDMGAFHLQPSEFVKIIVVIALAKYFSASEGEYLQLSELVRGGLIVFLPVALVILQKDIGTALSFFPIFIALAYCAGVRRKVVIAAVLVAVVLTPLVWFGLKDYHRERVKSVLDPTYDVQGIGYQSTQSKIAIGSGKLFGKGIKQGSQSRLGFLPGRHTDFIYAVLAEEVGFLGAILILLLYFLLTLRLIRIAREAKDRLGLLIIAGILSILLFHVMINIGMVLGLMPIIGIPLPFLSYGGSSLISNFWAIGLALNIGMRKYVN